jgi:AraC-like DNA-binding protein
MERIVAVHVVERVAWELLRVQVAHGFESPQSAVDQWNRILTMVEANFWVEIPVLLRALEDTGTRPSLAVRARDFLDHHATKKITLVIAAEATGSSVRHLTAEFRSRYGMGVHQYLIRRRLAEAVKLMLATDLKVSAVATSVGFQDKAELHRHFVRVLHSTPRSVRRDRESAAILIGMLELPDPRLD